MNKDVTNNNQLRSYVTKNMVTDFTNIPTTGFFVVGEFDQSAINDEGETVPCHGFIGTSKIMLDNIKLLSLAQPDGLVLYIDGTYKLLTNGWVLILLGGVTLKINNSGDCSHSFVPILECLTRSECEPAFAAIYKCFCKMADEYSNIALKVSVIMQDHCQASANALKNTLQHLVFQVSLFFISLV